MSGALFSIEGLYETTLLAGSFRGAPFTIVSADDEVGRRMAGFLFPGQDIRSFQDLGQFDGDIVVNGILVGDDYTAQADALRTAFQTAGPGTLVHPFLGTIQVVQKPDKYPKFSFNVEALRVCTFTATFLPYQPRQPPSPFSLTGLLNAIDALKGEALGLLSTVLSPVALALAVVSQVESIARDVGSIFVQLVAACSSQAVAVAAAQPLANLGAIDIAPLDATFAATAGALLEGPSAAIAGTTTPIIPSAVGPGGSTATPTPVDGRVTAQLILNAIAEIAAADLTGAPIQIPPGPSLILVAQSIMLADAVSAASAIDFDSQQEAMSWRDNINTVFVSLIDAAASLVPTSPIAVAALRRALVSARAQWIVNMNAAIGSLPAVVTFTPPAPAPVWLIAYYLYGSDPSRMTAMYQDLIARNGIFNPGIPVSGPLEVLEAQ